MTQLTEQIRQQLVTDILEGRYVPGSAFPTELETAERLLLKMADNINQKVWHRMEAHHES